jgi:hypothetical protein
MQRRSSPVYSVKPGSFASQSAVIPRLGQIPGEVGREPDRIIEARGVSVHLRFQGVCSMQRLEGFWIEGIDLDYLVAGVACLIEKIVFGLADHACGEADIVQHVAGRAVEHACAHRVPQLRLDRNRAYRFVERRFQRTSNTAIGDCGGVMGWIIHAFRGKTVYTRAMNA